MKFNNILLHTALATLLPVTLAYPGGKWTEKLAEIKARAARPVDSPEDSNELLGDLVTPGPSTPIGQVRVPISRPMVFLTRRSLLPICLSAMQMPKAMKA